MFDVFLPALQQQFFGTLFSVLYYLMPIWLPVMLFSIFMVLWMRYIRTDYIISQGSVMLEVKLPQEITKSPLAMELIFVALYQTGKTNYIETYWTGKVRPWFSFEMVSIDGEVRFFIWTPKKFKRLIEAQIYSQYPTVEIFEAEDYTKNFFYDPSKTILWGTNFKLEKDDVYPIKTYVDYGLDKDPKEEFKIDPMTSVIEYLGSLRKGEQTWIQILFRAQRDNDFKNDAYIKKSEHWKDKAKAEIEKKIEELRAGERYRQPTEGEKEIISALERSKSKLPFEVGIRGIYIADKEVFDSVNITGLIGSVRQYNSNNLNGFKLGKWTDFDYPWQDFKRKKRTALEHKFIKAYKLRSYFHAPYRFVYKTKSFVLNTEELATIYHFPGKVAATPTLTKTPSKKSEAPANLPV